MTTDYTPFIEKLVARMNTTQHAGTFDELAQAAFEAEFGRTPSSTSGCDDFYIISAAARRFESQRQLIRRSTAEVALLLLDSLYMHVPNEQSESLAEPVRAHIDGGHIEYMSWLIRAAIIFDRVFDVHGGGDEYDLYLSVDAFALAIADPNNDTTTDDALETLAVGSLREH